MSEEKTSNPVNAGTIVAHTPPEEPDWLLATWVRALNASEKNDLSMPIVLSVGGSLVGGELVSGRVYFDGLIAEARAANAPGFVWVWETLGKPYKNDDDEAEDKQPLEPTYIHLKNARYYTAGHSPIPANCGVWWRGKLSAVDAFFFETLSPEVGARSDQH